MIEVVVWKWKKPGYRSTFGPDTVNVSRSMFARQLKVPHRFTCVTDDPTGIELGIRVIDITTLPSYKFMSVPNPSSPVNPSCYVRLFIFSPEARDVFGERIVSVDLDMVLTGDVTPLFDRDVDFAIWGGQAVQPRSSVVYNWFNGSLMMVRAGARSKVWTEFDPSRSPARAHLAGCRGSDQGWIAYCLGRNEVLWGANDGVYSYRNHVLPAGGRLPKGARVVAFHGAHDPWHRDVQIRSPWVREHYR